MSYPQNQKKKTMIFNYVLFIYLITICNCRIILPSVPDYLHPPIPDAVNLTTINLLSEMDPELTPGLFQGDMAMDNSMHKHWRIGLR